MILRFTVTDPAAGRDHDVEMIAEPDSSVATMLDALPVRIGGRACYVGAEPLAPDTTVQDSPLVVGAHVTVGEPGPPIRPIAADHAGILRVVEGPDAGEVLHLRAGTQTLGRLASCDLRLRDPMVSRHYADLTVTPHSVGITSTAAANKANGTLLDGTRISGTRAMHPGSRFQIGEDVIEYTPQAQTLQSTRSPDGRLEFDRAYSPAPAVRHTVVQLPVAPGAGGGLKAMLTAVAAPVVLGVVMALALRQWQMLMFAAFAPATAGTSYFTERRQRRQRAKDFEAAKGKAGEQISHALDSETLLRRQQTPDPAGAILIATGAQRGLWPRDRESADGLVVRIGVADREPDIALRGDPWPGFEPPMLREVPVTLNLRQTGVLGIVGQPAQAEPVANWLIAQLATFHSPDDLRLVVLTPDGAPGLAWTRWLPHLDSGNGRDAPCAVGNTSSTRAARVEELKNLITLRLDALREQGGTTFDEDVVVVLQGALALRKLPGMRELLRDGHRVGVYCICVDDRDMNECRGIVEFGAGGVTVRRQRSELPETAREEAISTADAERLARALAPMRDRLISRGDPSSIPYPVRFLDLMHVDRPTPDDVLARWKDRPGPTLEVPLGAGTQGTVMVNLAKQGPHTMLAGATGAGKSILLQTLVTSLLLANRPDELNLVLVDFKGGSAFLPFENCPHVVALIRNTEDDPAERFDEAAAARVLASVRAEVRRRESILGRHGGEIDHYWHAKSRNPQLPPLPRLVMVFDEYARAMDTSPDFPKELVAVAGKGRSLGMHLVFATQSLQGKLSAEMKNNISLRITLRQNEKSDSNEVLGVPDAVTIPGRLRGRGLILCTLDETRQPRPFQSGFLGNLPPTGVAPPAHVRLVAWPALGLPRPAQDDAPAGVDTDQSLAVAAIEAAAARLALPPTKRPLLPPLPATVALEDLGRLATVPAASAALPFALADDSEHQEQPALALDLAGAERLMIAGGAQSGRTTAVRALITSLAGFSPDLAQFYLVSAKEAELDDYEALPHCGGVVYASEPERIRRLISWLGHEVQRRTRERFSQTTTEPYLVLLVDGWECLENRGQGLFDETSVLAGLYEIISSGPPSGVHVVAAGGQQMVSSRLPDSFTRRVLLRFPNESTRKAALANGAISVPVPLPGRGVEAWSGWHLQVAEPRGPVSDLVRATPVSMLRPHRFIRMPVDVDIDDPALWDAAMSPTWIPLGLGGPDVQPLGTDLFESDPHTLLISGSGGSGRSTAAAAVIHGLRRAGISVLAIASARSRLWTLLDADSGISALRRTSLHDTELRDAAARFEGERYAIVVDDCEQLKLTPSTSTETFGPAPTLLDDVADPAAAGQRALVFCGDGGQVLDGASRSVARFVEGMVVNGTRVVLWPSNLFTAKQLGITLERDQILPMPPGRGFLATGRTSQLIQLAQP